MDIYIYIIMLVVFVGTICIYVYIKLENAVPVSKWCCIACIAHIVRIAGEYRLHVHS